MPKYYATMYLILFTSVLHILNHYILNNISYNLIYAFN